MSAPGPHRMTAILVAQSWLIAVVTGAIVAASGALVIGSLSEPWAPPHSGYVPMFVFVATTAVGIGARPALLVMLAFAAYARRTGRGHRGLAMLTGGVLVGVPLLVWGQASMPSPGKAAAALTACSPLVAAAGIAGAVWASRGLARLQPRSAEGKRDHGETRKPLCEDRP